MSSNVSTSESTQPEILAAELLHEAQLASRYALSIDTRLMTKDVQDGSGKEWNIRVRSLMYTWTDLSEETAQPKGDGVFIMNRSDGRIAIGESPQLFALSQRSTELQESNQGWLDRMAFRKWSRIRNIGIITVGYSTFAEGITQSGTFLKSGVVGIALAGAGYIASRRRMPGDRADKVNRTIQNQIQEFKDNPEIILPSPLARWQFTIDSGLNEKFNSTGYDGIRGNVVGDYDDLSSDYAVKNMLQIHPSGLIKSLISQDATPKELWRERLLDDAKLWLELDDQISSLKDAFINAKKRQDFTGVVSDSGEIDQIQNDIDKLRAKLLIHITETVAWAQARRDQQRHDQKIKDMFSEKQSILEESINTPNNELQHPQSRTLEVFRDLTKEVALSVDPEDEAQVEDLRGVYDYVIQIATYMNNSNQAKQFYNGLKQKFPSAKLPDWEEVEPRFLKAAIAE